MKVEIDTLPKLKTR